MTGRVILVSQVGAATGARAAAAALACAGSNQDRAGLLVDLTGRPPRPSLIASAPARALEERLVAHVPDGHVASRGLTCHLGLPSDPTGLERIAAALAIVRDSVGVVHLPPPLLQPALGEAHLRASAALLCADLSEDRALTALAVRDLIAAGIRVAVLKRPLGWIASRRALVGIAAPGGASGLPPRLCKRLLDRPEPAEAPNDRI